MDNRLDTRPASKPNLAGLADDSLTSDQEAVAVPYIAGEDIIPIHWVTQVYNLKPVESDDQFSKK